MELFNIGTASQLEQQQLVCLKLSCEAVLSQSNLCILSQTAERQQLEMKAVKSSAFNQQWGNFEVFILPLTSSKDAPLTSQSVTIIKSSSMIKPRRSTEEARKPELS